MIIERFQAYTSLKLGKTYMEKMVAMKANRVQSLLQFAWMGQILSLTIKQRTVCVQ